MAGEFHSGKSYGISIDSSGFDEFMKELEEYDRKTDHEQVMAMLQTGAELTVEDANKLPKPISRINAPGYTHLVVSFAYRVNGNEVEVGWGKYYGPMVEGGTAKMRAQPHLIPMYNRNQDRYIAAMREKFFE